MWLNYESQNSQSLNPSAYVFPNPILADGFRDSGFGILRLVAISTGPFSIFEPGQLIKDLLCFWLIVCVYVFQIPGKNTTLLPILLLPMVNIKDDLQSKGSSVSPLTGSSLNWESSSRCDTASMRTLEKNIFSFFQYLCEKTHCD